MRLVWKGIYKDESQLPRAALPAGAVRFREPETPLQLNIAACAFVPPVFLLYAAALLCRNLLYGAVSGVVLSLWGLLLALLSIYPHELLHAVLFPRGAEVELWFAPKTLNAFVVSTAPMRKGRFILVSLFPNLILGFLPLLIWIFLPPGPWADTLNNFSLYSLLFGVGDYLNVWNAARQMPRGAVTRLSGFHSYWYLP